MSVKGGSGAASRGGGKVPGQTAAISEWLMLAPRHRTKEMALDGFGFESRQRPHVCRWAALRVCGGALCLLSDCALLVCGCCVAPVMMRGQHA